MTRQGLIPSGGAFFTLRIKYPEHERIVALGKAEPKWLHTVALAQCNEHLTDGHIDPFRLKVICAAADLAKPGVWIKRLVEVGLWVELEDGHYEIRDYLDYNPSAADVKTLQEARRAAGRLGGQAKAEADALASDVASATAGASPDGASKRLADKKRTDREKKEDQGQVPCDLDSSSVLSVSKTVKPHPLGAGRDEALALLASRVVGGDNGTLTVLWKHCRQLPKERIEGVAAKFQRRRVPAGVAVNALKAEIKDYDRELRLEPVNGGRP